MGKRSLEFGIGYVLGVVLGLILDYSFGWHL